MGKKMLVAAPHRFPISFDFVANTLIKALQAFVAQVGYTMILDACAGGPGRLSGKSELVIGPD